MISAVKLLSINAGDEEILELCREWVDLVAAGRYADAVDMLDVPPTSDPLQHWTPETLQTYIGNYGSWEPRGDGRRSRMTPLRTARTPANRPEFRPRAEVIRLDSDRTAGSVELDVPLDGEWSDLTAQFEFRQIDRGIGLSLYDLHVL